MRAIAPFPLSAPTGKLHCKSFSHEVGSIWVCRWLAWAEEEAASGSGITYGRLPEMSDELVHLRTQNRGAREL